MTEIATKSYQEKPRGFQLVQTKQKQQNRRLDNIISHESYQMEEELKQEFEISTGNSQSQQAFQQLASIIQLAQLCPEYQRENNYVIEFKNESIQNYEILKQIEETINDSKQLYYRLAKVEKRIKKQLLEIQEEQEEIPKKKSRRPMSEIQKRYYCPYQNCQKGYGSDVSLNLHIKLKHNGGSKTERDKLAKTLLFAQVAKVNVPKTDIQFPPGYFESFLKKELIHTTSEQQKNNNNQNQKNNNQEKDELSTKSESSLCQKIINILK